MTKKYSIAGKEFLRQKDLKSHISKMFAKYDSSTPLKDDDLSFVLDLLSHHPDVKKKIGSGIESIFTGKAQHGTTCFYIKRKDGSTDDFSTVKCVNNYSL